MTGRGLKVARHVVEKETDRTKEREREPREVIYHKLLVARAALSIGQSCACCNVMCNRRRAWRRVLWYISGNRHWLRGRNAETRLSSHYTLSEYSPAYSENSSQSFGERVFPGS